MKKENSEKWVQVTSDFLLQYQVWKDNLIKKQQESFLFSTGSESGQMHRIGVESVYEKSPPIPGGSILKKQILSQASLTPLNGSDKFRLAGDFFGYLKNLEDQNRELQVQLDTAVGKLEKSQLEAIRAQNKQNEHKETLNNQMSVLIGEYKKAEQDHQIHLKELSETVGRLQQELALKSIAIERQKKERITTTEFTIYEEVKSFLPSSTESKEKEGSNDLTNPVQLKALLDSEQSKNVYLSALCDKANQELIDKEKEVDQLWFRVYELHQNLKDARESDIEYQNQSIAIEELRSQLELARKTTSVLEQASIIEAMLPSKSDRLVRNEEGWEWTPWVKNVTTKALDVDFPGIMEEFKDLKEHRTQAFKRAKNRGMDIVQQILKDLGLLRLTNGYGDSTDPLDKVERSKGEERED